MKSQMELYIQDIWGCVKFLSRRAELFRDVADVHRDCCAQQNLPPRVRKFHRENMETFSGLSDSLATKASELVGIVEDYEKGDDTALSDDSITFTLNNIKN